MPEVETLRRGLEREALGKRITDVMVANPKTLKGQSETILKDRVIGRSVEQVNRRGKYLLMPLSSPGALFSPTHGPSPRSLTSLCIHLKMRGQLLVEDAAAPVGPYHCVTLSLETGRQIRFYDMWTWGELRALTAGEIEGIAGLANMGTEPLTSEWDGAMLAALLANRKAPIKPALLDQKIVAGIGNIYADESLFRARIHPERSCLSLSRDEVDRLAEAIRAVLHEAVEGGGTTSEDYVDVGGNAGRYTPRVYDRKGLPCVFCGTTLTRIRLGGRGTVFCSQCQA